MLAEPTYAFGSPLVSAAFFKRSSGHDLPDFFLVREDLHVAYGLCFCRDAHRQHDLAADGGRGALICAVCLRGLGGACDFRFVAGVIGYAAEVLRDEAPAEQQTHARGERGTPLRVTFLTCGSLRLSSASAIYSSFTPPRALNKSIPVILFPPFFKARCLPFGDNPAAFHACGGGTF